MGEPLHDLEGRDIQSPANAEEGTSETRQGTAHGRILVSIVGTNGIIYSTAVLLPASYLVRNHSQCDGQN